MDTGDLNHFGIAPATAFPVYQNDESRLPIFQNEMYNQNGSTRYAGASCGYSSIIYEPLPVFPHPGGYIPSTYQAYPYGATLDVTNLMPYGSQFNHVQQPMSRRNFMSYGDSLSVPYYSQVGRHIKFRAKLSLPYSTI
ncbi:hypothetical protein L1049_023222 [Liquidambar formosana]|uniref:Uncharacterized protein n=1 Tax=Liquidambar formosana TaxID=63359 RepID=A0AAP0WPP2_LIQFO